MVKTFLNKFGKLESTIFVIEDYDKENYNMKGIKPIIYKKFKRIFFKEKNVKNQIVK